MSVYNDKFIFYHVPKTGGTWVRLLLTHLGIQFEMHGTSKSSFHETYKEFRPEGLFSFTAVRHPITWLQSYFSYRLRVGWSDVDPLGKVASSSTFDAFVDKVIDRAPGCISGMYRDYVGDPQEVDYVCHQETLREDMIYVLSKLGYQFDEKLVSNLPPALAFNQRFEFLNGTKEKIIELENYTINRFYRDHIPA